MTEAEAMVGAVAREIHSAFNSAWDTSWEPHKDMDRIRARAAIRALAPVIAEAYREGALARTPQMTLPQMDAMADKFAERVVATLTDRSGHER